MSSKQPDDNSQILDDLGSLQSCPLCQTKYIVDDVVVVEELQEASLLHCKCPTCFASILVLLVGTEFGISTVGVLTDLSIEDASSMSHAEPISQDDVLTLHEILKNKEKNIFHYVYKNN